MGSRPHVGRTLPAAARPAAPIARDRPTPSVLAGFVSDAAHVPGGHAGASAFPKARPPSPPSLPAPSPCCAIGSQSSLTGGATPRGERAARHAAPRRRSAPTSDRNPWSSSPGVVLADARRARSRRAANGTRRIPTYDGATVGGTVADQRRRARRPSSTARPAPGSARSPSCSPAAASLEIATRRGHREPRRPLRDRRRRRRHGAASTFPPTACPSVRKLAAGYYAAPDMDLVDLFIGAEGTLGVVTSVTLGVLRRLPS